MRPFTAPGEYWMRYGGFAGVEDASYGDEQVSDGIPPAALVGCPGDDSPETRTGTRVWISWSFLWRRGLLGQSRPTAAFNRAGVGVS